MALDTTKPTPAAARDKGRRAPSGKPSLRHLIYRAHQAAQATWRELSPDADLEPRQYDILRAVEQLQVCSQTALTKATGCDRSTLADVVRRLCKAGLLQRRRNKADAREWCVMLTDAGRTTVELIRSLERKADASIRLDSAVQDLAVALAARSRA